MGTGLRALLRDYKGKKLDDGKSLGGRGRLTMQVIDSFQVFYGIAPRSNKGDPQEMGRGTKAILHHYASTRDRPQHQFCPSGRDSWCKYNKDLATGEETYRPLKYALPDSVVEVVKPKIEQLASPTLLNTVSECRSQNPNEALHSMLWRYTPKSKYHSDISY